MRNVKDYSWIIRGKQRREIIRYLKDEDTPTELARKSGYSLNHASRVLRDFVRKDIVKCINENDKTGRLYVLTEKGRKLKKKVVEKT